MSAIKTTLALLALTAIGAGVCYAEFPANRVRLQRAAMQNQYPTTIYPDNRVVIRRFWIEPGADGMAFRIKGEVWTDFEVEAGHGLPAGQMTGLIVDVMLKELGEFDREVPGQVITATVTTTEQNLGVCSFELPELAKPLPPGAYKLVAAIRFEGQPARLRDGLKWCPDWYGGWINQDTGDQGEVYGHAEYHPRAHGDLLKSVGKVKGDALLLVGDLRGINGAGDFGRPGAEKVLCKDGSHEVTTWLLNFEKQSKDIEDNYKAEVAAAANDKAKLNKARVKRDTLAGGVTKNIAVLGGAATREEKAEHARVSAIAARLQALIADWEDNLREKYWLLLDAHLFYGAYNAIDLPGANAARAVASNDNAADKKARVDAMNDPIKVSAREKRIQAFRDQKPLPLIEEAYLKFVEQRDNSGDWDSERFTSGAAKVTLNTRKWREYVLKAAKQCLKDTQPILDALKTTGDYCIQKWPEAYDHAVAARAAALTLGFAYEFAMRTGSVMKEDAPTVNDDLEAAAVADLELAGFIRAAKDLAQDKMQTKFKQGYAAAKKGIPLDAFIKRRGKK